VIAADKTYLNCQGTIGPAANGLGRSWEEKGSRLYVFKFDASLYNRRSRLMFGPNTKEDSKSSESVERREGESDSYTRFAA
jgi:hypothetical protein